MKSPFLSMLIIFAVSFSAKANDSAIYFFQKGVEEKAAKRYLVAAKNFETAILHNPNYVQAYIESGYTNLEMRKMRQALNNFTKVNELEPTNEIAIKELASLYFAFKQYQKAVEFANKCNSCDNKEKIIGISYYQDENYGLAEKTLSAYMQKNPTDADAAFALARTYLELEDQAKGIQFYEVAVTNNPKMASWHNELGLLYYNINKYPQAINEFKKATESGLTQSNDFKENLAFAYIYSKNPTDAEPILQDLITRKAGNKELLRDIAEAYYTAKLYDNSLSYCQRLMEMDIKDGKALYQAGLCFQKKGETDRGQKMCDTAIEMDPSLAKMRTQKSFSTGL